MCTTHIPDKKFDGTNYRLWSMQMKYILQTQKLWIFITQRLEPTAYRDYQERHDQAFGMVMLSMEVRIQLLFESETKVYELWRKLEDAYAELARCPRMWIFSALPNNVKLQPYESVDSYVARIQTVVDEYTLNSGSKYPEVLHIQSLLKGLEENAAWKPWLEKIDRTVEAKTDNIPKIVLQLRHIERLLKAV
jgi:hypothetical protein